MRLLHKFEDEPAPRTFFGVGGYKISPNALTDPAQLTTTRQRLHMVADELINKCCTLIDQEKDSHILKEISNSEITSTQLHEFADMVAEGKYGTKVYAQHMDDGSRILTFTLNKMDGN
jgi:hypothetical protein